jgi:hypothetical protein
MQKALLAVALPVLPCGSFNLYAGEVDTFDEAARVLLQEMVADIGFAWEHFDREARRRKSNNNNWIWSLRVPTMCPGTGIF